MSVAHTEVAAGILPTTLVTRSRRPLRPMKRSVLERMTLGKRNYEPASPRLFGSESRKPAYFAAGPLAGT